MINRDRLVRQFMELVRIPSPSKREGRVARALKKILKEHSAILYGQLRIHESEWDDIIEKFLEWHKGEIEKLIPKETENPYTYNRDANFGWYQCCIQTTLNKDKHFAELEK